MLEYIWFCIFWEESWKWGELWHSKSTVTVTTIHITGTKMNKQENLTHTQDYFPCEKSRSFQATQITWRRYFGFVLWQSWRLTCHEVIPLGNVLFLKRVLALDFQVKSKVKGDHIILFLLFSFPPVVQLVVWI